MGPKLELPMWQALVGPLLYVPMMEKKGIEEGVAYVESTWKTCA